MEYKRKCSKCAHPMHKIGPFARRKPEGQEAIKFNGIYEYQCINDKCSEHEKIVQFSADEEGTLEEKMSEPCQCDHVRGMHGYSLANTETEERTYAEQLDKECSGTDCTCEVFALKK